MDYTFLYHLGLSLILGSFIGIERQIHHDQNEGHINRSILGLRTFALTAILGTIAGMVYKEVPSLFILITIGVFILTCGYYFFDSQNTKDFGITTEISLIFTYLIGVLISIEILPQQFVIAVTVLLLVLLSQKEKLAHYIKMIHKEEIKSFISYLVVALVILPILPNTSITISSIPNLSQVLTSLGLNTTSFANLELINPFKLWLFVALVTGIEVFGYVLEKALGKSKGWMMTSFVGGFISSTATTQSLSQHSKKNASTNFLVSAAISASLASLIQNTLLIMPLNFELFIKILPQMLIMIFTALAILSVFLKNQSQTSIEEDVKAGKLFNITPALKFAFIFLIIKFLSGIALIIFGSSGFLIANALGAIPGLDAPLINIAELAGEIVNIEFASLAVILAIGVNMSVKSFISITQGSKNFGIRFSLSVAIVLLTGILSMIFI